MYGRTLRNDRMISCSEYVVSVAISSRWCVDVYMFMREAEQVSSVRGACVVRAWCVRGACVVANLLLVGWLVRGWVGRRCVDGM